MGYTSQSSVYHVAHLNSWEEFPEFNSFDSLSVDSNLGCGLLAGERSITQAWPLTFRLPFVTFSQF